MARTLMLTLASLAVAQDPLSLDDACSTGEPCGLHALQVGLSSVKSASVSIANVYGRNQKEALGDAASTNSTAEANAWPDILSLYKSLDEFRQKVEERSPALQYLQTWSFAEQAGKSMKVHSEEVGVQMPLDAIFRQYRQLEMEDPAFRAEVKSHQFHCHVGFIVCSILPFLMVMIEVPKKSKNGSPIEAKKQTSLKITQKELNEHNTASSLWISVGGVVCDVTDFLMLHPGGPDVLLQHAGTEAFDAFEEIGHSDFARGMVHERAVGLLVDGEASGKTGSHGTTILSRLFTKEDSKNFHKILGFFILGHVLYRMWAQMEWIPDAGFTSSFLSLASVWVCFVLQCSSFQFDVPRARLLGSPMIWQEWRAHNFVFVTRHVLSFTLCWAYQRWYPADHDRQFYAKAALEIGSIIVLYWQLYTVDVITAWIREDKHTSLTASWPFWDGCPLWLEKFIKFYYTIAQFQASTIMVFTGENLASKFLVIFPFQFASFLMTLVRKGIITTKGFHAGYLWSLFTVVWCILGPNIEGIFAGTVIWCLMYTVRFYGLSKYALWFGPLVASILYLCKMADNGMLTKMYIMMICWVGCMIVQKIFMGFTLEVRARRFLEARQKPLVLDSREVVNNSLMLLRFKLPSGYSAGMNPGQHVKVHVPNNSFGCKTWNNAKNLEEPAEILSRSYTPVSCTTSPTLDFLVRRYPKSPERGFPDGGRASTHLTEEVEVGTEVMMSGPHGHQIYFGQGSFLIGKDTVKARACGALAAGSGITPVLAVLRDIWQEGRRSIADRDQRILGEEALKMEEFCLVHVTRTAEEALSPDWYVPPAGGQGQQTPIRVSHLLTGNAQKAEVPGATNCWTGKLSEEMARQALPPPGDDVVILVCGPQGFNESLCRPLLEQMGYKHVKCSTDEDVQGGSKTLPAYEGLVQTFRVDFQVCTALFETRAPGL
eukprot:CAMPEP_0197652050 /NCGR_PEP_ID=MMETSP1338-20131121/34212_1 /TAXON_ID=43686 ORGANISM="Pelagodinium beii, Strain RCC1491" /NCGR_SAMPLE_ID=MMETSP1338 /ASSEMBLY_ACC=CAM_ASM_000754 /LENGTH=939 /DNA_ID=CAMNT_0043226843 /DNA_START=110 /DNA_END=2930 /DNA_ORIENTATION=-